jgi:exoribonuclease R
MTGEGGVMARSKRVEKARKGGLTIGRITINRRGYGFVQAEEGDIYVASRDTAGAMHRDVVGVRVSSHAGQAGPLRRGREGDRACQ